MVWKKFCFFRQSPLRPPETHTRTPLTDGVWPSGKATVFGTEDRRFESYHPSQYFPAIDVRATEPRLAPIAPVSAPVVSGSLGGSGEALKPPLGDVLGCAFTACLS